MLYTFFWVIPRRLNFICRRFGTLCLFHLHRQVGYLPTCLWRWNRQTVPKRRHSSLYKYLPMNMEQSVPKRRHIKFRRWGITQKKTYNNFWYVTRSRAPSKLSRYGVTMIRGNVTSVYQPLLSITKNNTSCKNTTKHRQNNPNTTKRLHFNFLFHLLMAQILLHQQVNLLAYLPMKMEQSVPKRRHVKFRRRGITQKKTYNFWYVTRSRAPSKLSRYGVTMIRGNVTSV